MAVSVFETGISWDEISELLISWDEIVERGISWAEIPDVEAMEVSMGRGNLFGRSDISDVDLLRKCGFGKDSGKMRLDSGIFGVEEYPMEIFETIGLFERT